MKRKLIRFLRWLLFILETDKPINDGIRRSGRTTRRVDYFVQQFFKTGKCSPRDHFRSVNADKMIVHLIIDRLNYEHGADFKVIEKRFNRVELRKNERKNNN